MPYFPTFTSGLQIIFSFTAAGGKTLLSFEF
jgi:hypothetical protein